jgi:hypothetical protein
MRFVLCTLVASTLFAQKADFSGSWVMNKAKSDFGQMPEQMVPEKLAMKIAATATEMKTTSTQVGARGENVTDAVYKLDGVTENVNQAMGGEMKTIAKWVGDDTVVLTSAREVQGMALTIEQRFTKPSADVMLITSKIGGTPMGDIVMKYQMERTGGAAPVAAAKPAVPTVFAGAWKLNKAKSNFGALPEEYQPASINRIVEHDAKLVHIKSTQVGAQGEVKADMKVKLDGSESVNMLMGGEAKSIGKWDGPSVVVNTKQEIQGMALEITEKWVKVDDKTMNIETKIAGTPIGDILMTYVFEKE